MTKEKTIYDLDLFETILFKTKQTDSYYIEITRVPGGWIFGKKDGVCFVPYNEEFKNKKYDYKE